MQDINDAAQYYLFMKWFKNNYPQLYAKYKLHIRVPAESSGIQAAIAYIEPQDRKMLQDAINEYYTNVPYYYFRRSTF